MSMMRGRKQKITSPYSQSSTDEHSNVLGSGLDGDTAQHETTTEEDGESSTPLVGDKGGERKTRHANRAGLVSFLQSQGRFAAMRITHAAIPPID